MIAKNENNWIAEDNSSAWHKKALIESAKHKEWEKERKFKTIRIDSRTVILKDITDV